MSPTLGESFRKLEEGLEGIERELEEIEREEATKGAGRISTSELLRRAKIRQRGAEPRQPLTKEQVLEEKERVLE